MIMIMITRIMMLLDPNKYFLKEILRLIQSFRNLSSDTEVVISADAREHCTDLCENISFYFDHIISYHICVWCLWKLACHYDGWKIQTKKRKKKLRSIQVTFGDGSKTIVRRCKRNCNLLTELYELTSWYEIEDPRSQAIPNLTTWMRYKFWPIDR